jgi:hypothetical protein
VRRIDRKRFNSMVISTTWTILKQRNARAFGNAREQKSVDQMVVEIREEFHLWEREARYRERVGPGGGVVCVCLSTAVLSCILLCFFFYKDKTRFTCVIRCKRIYNF